MSDIFDRMEADRKLKDEKVKMQRLEEKGGHFDLGEYLQRKKALMKEKEQKQKHEKDVAKRKLMAKGGFT